MARTDGLDFTVWANGEHAASTEARDRKVRIERTIYRCSRCERARKAAGEKRPIVARKVERRYVLVPGWVAAAGRYRPATHHYIDHTPAPECCGTYMRSSGPVTGRYRADIPCTEKCVAATGPACECSCGGANHGAGHA